MASAELQEVLALLQQRAQARQGKVLTWDERRQSYDDLGMAFEDLDGVTLSDGFDAGGVALRFQPGRKECLSALSLRSADPDLLLARAGAEGLAVDRGGFELAGVRWQLEQG